MPAACGTKSAGGGRIGLILTTEFQRTDADNGLAAQPRPATDSAAGFGSRPVPGAASLAAEVARLRLQLITASAENERLRETISFQLGGLILRARTLRGLIDLPSGLWRLRQQSLHLRGRRSAGMSTQKGLEDRIQHLIGQAANLEVDEIVVRVKAECDDSHLAARLVAHIAQGFLAVDYDKSRALAHKVIEINDGPRHLMWLADFLFDNGQIDAPRALMDRARRTSAFIPSRLKVRHEVMEGAVRVRERGLPLAPRGAAPRFQPRPRTVMYVAASSFPHHTTGYTARTQALIKAIGGAGWTVEAVTRPGYPHDRNNAANVTAKLTPHDVDGVTYNRLPAGASHSTPLDRYAEQSCKALLNHIHQKRPSVVHAASNYVNAAPALMAARKAGLPFIYEVRGLWELTQCARTPHWEGSERFEQQRAMETFVAREADAVVAISHGLRGELIARGVDERKIQVVPNSVDSDRFSPRPRDKALVRQLALGDKKVLGFLGSMTAYEGLVDLVTALAELRHSGVDACALLVGEGPAFREVQEAARNMGVSDHLIMPGRVPHMDTPRWYSVMDVAVYPRRPSQVTELVPPLKPLEAMSMALPVVASNVSAIRETLIDRENSYLFEKGDVHGLASLLEEVLASPAQSLQIGRAARRDVQKRFTWARAAGTLDGLYGQHV
jgi:glycosyltransferase involved in cell wall biosynthesis